MLTLVIKESDPAGGDRRAIFATTDPEILSAVARAVAKRFRFEPAERRKVIEIARGSKPDRDAPR